MILLSCGFHELVYTIFKPSPHFIVVILYSLRFLIISFKCYIFFFVLICHSPFVTRVFVDVKGNFLHILLLYSKHIIDKLPYVSSVPSNELKMLFLLLVLPAGPTDVARSSAAEAAAAVHAGPPGGLHGSHPHLRPQAPPDRRADGIHTGGSHCLLGGPYTLPFLFASSEHMSESAHVSSCVCLFPPTQAFYISPMFKSCSSELSAAETPETPLSPHHTLC